MERKMGSNVSSFKSLCLNRMGFCLQSVIMNKAVLSISFNNCLVVCIFIAV